MLRVFSADQGRTGILSRPDWDELVASPALNERTREVFGEAISPDEAVRRILASVRRDGDRALMEWTKKLDGTVLSPATIPVSRAEIKAAYAELSPELVEALKLAAARISAFHSRQVFQSWAIMEHGMMGQKVCPIGRVGCYIPGGSAPLASTLLMTALVARAAGVPRIIACSPPDRRTGKIAAITRVAADIAGIDELYCVGGAQAIGAMAFGTETIERVDKICGPGNTFVVLAKRQVFGSVGIDALPGPTETVVVADEGARPDWIASDLLAQSEHGGGTAILISPSKKILEEVDVQLEAQVAGLSTEKLIRESFSLRGGAILCRDLGEAVALADEYAPEHLCLSVADPWAWIGQIRRAGGVFLGEHSYEVLGDYVAGPSHTMPTGGTARFTSPCNVLDFVRVMNIVALDEPTARSLAPSAVLLAEAENLPAHAAAARMRLAK